MWLSIGDIMNRVRNSVSFRSIWLGGVDCVFSVWCRKLSMMMMWVNEVIISSIVGSSVSIVISVSICSDSV